jgi:methyl-accepting chemotaxis protein
LTRSISEQAVGGQEITAAASDLDHQTKEASRSMKEQAQSFKQITSNTANISKQIKMIAAANLENSQSTVVILQRIQEVRDVSRENAESATGIEDLLGGMHKTKASLTRHNHRRGSASSASETGRRT